MHLLGEVGEVFVQLIVHLLVHLRLQVNDVHSVNFVVVNAHGTPELFFEPLYHLNNIGVNDVLVEVSLDLSYPFEFQEFSNIHHF